MHPIRVVLADDDDGMRSALTDVLSADPRFAVVGSVATGEELLALVTEHRPDVVLLDVRMPGGGPAAAHAVLSHPRPPVVVAVSASTDLSTVTSMLRAGVTGYLGKGRLGGLLPEMVARCADGEVLLAVPNALTALQSLVARPDVLPSSVT